MRLFSGQYCFYGLVQAFHDPYTTLPIILYVILLLLLLQADTITLRSTDGVMTESAPSTSYGYHRSRPRDQLPSNKGDEVYHKLADTQSTAYGKATDKPRGNTSSSESPIHSKSSRPAEAKDYRFWQCACKTVNKATNSCCELCMQNCAYMAGKECLCEDCKVKMFISQENSNVCPMCKKAVSK